MYSIYLLILHQACTCTSIFHFVSSPTQSIYIYCTVCALIVPTPHLLTILSKIWLTPLLLNTMCPLSANSVDPDQLASEEANWSGSTLFVIKYVNFYQKLESSNLTGWKLEVGVPS